MTGFLIASFSFLMFINVSASENKEKSPLESTVRFYNNIEMEEFADWESRFFGLFPDADPREKDELKVDSNMEAVDAEIIKPAPIKKRSEPVIKKPQLPESAIPAEDMEAYQTTPVKEKSVVDEIAGKKSKRDPIETEIKKKMEHKDRDIAQEPVKTEESPVLEPDDEENDEEQVDSSERMRKMKEMMRRKKGNRRIEDRRVY